MVSSSLALGIKCNVTCASSTGQGVQAVQCKPEGQPSKASKVLSSLTLDFRQCVLDCPTLANPSFSQRSARKKGSKTLEPGSITCTTSFMRCGNKIGRQSILWSRGERGMVLYRIASRLNLDRLQARAPLVDGLGCNRIQLQAGC